MDDESVYKIKRIKWPPWATNPSLVPVLLQDVNGPCPLLAILNVLLLRGSIALPNSGFGEVTQSRAVQMLAEHLLDTNFSRSEGGSNEFKANLQHNLSDAIALLPKLCSGLDVNVRFDGVRSIEFTGETAVFDLLGIDLVHGWLVDPQDEPTAAAIGQRSYNDVVLQIVAALGRDATPASISRRSTAASLAGGGSFSARGSSITGATAAAPATSPKEPGKIDAATLSAALQSTLRVTIPEDPPIGLDLRSKSTAESCISQDSVTSAINKMLGETVKEAFKTPTVSANARSRTYIIGGIDEEGKGKQAEEEEELKIQAGDAEEQPEGGGDLTGNESEVHGAVVLGEGKKEEQAPQTPSREKRNSSTTQQALLVGETPSPPPPPPATAAEEASPSSEKTRNPASTTPATTTKDGAAANEIAVRDALLSQEFLETNPSQLTVYGLSSLIENMKDQQLAVFFRNNHFNVLLKSGVGLYILVTDQGYLYEPEIVWEHLNNVDGDTELLGWDLKPFKQHAEAGVGAAGAGASGGESGGNTNITGQVSTGGGGVTAGPEHGEDADYALAVQLQQEEEARVRVEEERRRASSAAAARQGGGGGGRPPAPPGSRYSSRPQQEQRQQQPQEEKKKKKKGGTDCCIM